MTSTHIVPSAVVAVRDSAYASEHSGTRGVWALGYDDAINGVDDRANISYLWVGVYECGRAAGFNALQRAPSDPITDVEPA